MTYATRFEAKLEGKNARYKDYLARRKAGRPAVMDCIKFQFRSLAKAGRTELPTFTKMKELGDKAALAEKNQAAMLSLQKACDRTETEAMMLEWLISLPNGKSRSALLELHDLVSARVARGAVPAEDKIDSRGIENLMHRAAENGVLVTSVPEEEMVKRPCKADIGKEDKIVQVDYTVDSFMLEKTVGAMLHSLIAEGKAPRLEIHQTMSKEAIVIEVIPHLSMHAITLFEKALPCIVATPDNQCYVRDENYTGGKGTLLYIKGSPHIRRNPK